MKSVHCNSNEQGCRPDIALVHARQDVCEASFGSTPALIYFTIARGIEVALIIRLQRADKVVQLDYETISGRLTARRRPNGPCIVRDLDLHESTSYHLLT